MKKILTLCCLFLSVQIRAQAPCMDTTLDQSAICNLVPNSGFENGVCDSWIIANGLDWWHYDSLFPNYSRISNWMGHGFPSVYRTPKLFTTSAINSTNFIIPNTYNMFTPSWAVPPGVDVYAPVSSHTGVSNNRFVGIVAEDRHGVAGGMAVKLREPLQPNISYDLSFWVFASCEVYNAIYGVDPPLSGQTAIGVFLSDFNSHSAGARYYPEDSSLGNWTAYSVPTFIDCADTTSLSNGDNGWIKIEYSFEVPQTTNPLEWLVFSEYVNTPDNYHTFVFIDDVFLVPAEPLVPPDVTLAGSTAQCADDTYEIIDPNPNVVYKWHATNASNSPYVGTTYTPAWTNHTSGAEITVTAKYNNLTDCFYDSSAVLGSLTIYPCCENESMDVQLANKSSSYVINNILSSGNSWTTSDYIVIEGTFTVDTNFIFNNCPNILLGQNARIEIDSGMTLTIDGSTLRACGENMWYGIIIPHKAAKLVLNNSEVMEAEYAVTSILGGKFDIDSTLFQGNYLSIDMINKTATQTFHSPHALDWQIRNCTFRQEWYTLLPPHYSDFPLGGIRIADYWDGSSNSFYMSIGPNNDFDWLGYDSYGVAAVRSNVEVLNSTFYRTTGVKSIGVDINNDPDPAYIPQVVVNNNIFDDGTYGVKADYSQELIVINSLFTDVGIDGRYFDHEGSLFIADNNNMSFPNNTVWAAINSTQNMAVDISITNNMIHTDGNCAGIVVGASNSGDENECFAYVYRNLVFDAKNNGITSYGYGTFDKLSGGYGLYILDNYVEKPESSTSPASMCSAIAAYGNALIQDNVINYAVTYENLSTGIALSGTDFYLECNDVHDGDLGVFLLDGFDNFEYYKNGMRGPRSGGWWLKNSYVGNIGSSGNPPDNWWTPSLNDPYPNVDYTFPYVISDGSNGSLSNFYYRVTGGLNWLTPDNGIVANGGSALTTTSTSGEEYVCSGPRIGDEFVRQANPELITSDDGANLAKAVVTLEDESHRSRSAEKLYLKLSKKRGEIKNELVDSICRSVKNSAFGQLMEVFSHVEGAPSNADPQALLASVVAVREEDRLLKKVAAIAIRRRSSVNRELSADDIRTLNEIAGLCPMESGLAVFQARYFLGSHWSGQLNPCEYPDLKVLGAKQAEKVQGALTRVSIYPNPTAGMIEIKGFSEVINKIEVLDMTGRRVMSFQGEQASEKINLSSLEPDVYVISITGQTKSTQSKVIVTGK